MDAQVGRILDTLESRRRLDNTLVVFTATFGAELYAHHNYMLNWASPYYTVYRVPLLFRLPPLAPAGTEVARAVQSIDIAPTVLAALGAPAPGGLEGANLVPLMRGRDVGLSPVVSEYANAKALILCDDRYRYIYNPSGYQQNTIPQGVRDQFQAEGLEARGGRMRIEARELYDIRLDPLERQNLAHRRPSVRDAMERRIEAWAGARDWTAPEPVQ